MTNRLNVEIFNTYEKTKCQLIPFGIFIFGLWYLSLPGCFFNLWMIITFCVLILFHSHICNVPHISLFSVNNFKALFLCLCSFVSFVGKMTFQVSTTITITDPMPCRTVTLQVLHVPFVCVGVLFWLFLGVSG